MEMRLPLYPDAKHPDTFMRGLQYQDFVVEQLAKRKGIVIQIFSSTRYQFVRGESIQGWEIKQDKECTKYGRLSVEIAEKSNKDVPVWTPSGIFRDDNTDFYVQGNEEMFWIFFKKHLQMYFRKNNPEVTEKFGTIKTFYLPMDKADILGIRMDCIDGGNGA